MNRKRPVVLETVTQRIRLDEAVERTADHVEIERAVKHVLKDGVFDFIRSDDMIEGFKKSLNVERLQTKGLADIPWKEYFQRALMSQKVAKWLEKFADELADESMRHVGEDVGEPLTPPAEIMPPPGDVGIEIVGAQ